MKINIVEIKRDLINESPVECVERKGVGHPDSLCDGIAEQFSSDYSKYCIDKFGKIANHWVDKCMLIGGACDISFGYGKIVKPIQVFIVGKMTEHVGDHQIPIKDIANDSTYKYIHNVIPHIEKNDLSISIYTNNHIGAGRPNSWYCPNSIDEIPSPATLTANDASLCASYAPLSKLENMVLSLEKELNGKEFKRKHPETGTDIKILANRSSNEVHITVCIPFIANKTPSRSFYDDKKIYFANYINDFLKNMFDNYNYLININTRDDENTVYMTHLGTAADTGDVGVVGRGNRKNGLISPCRDMSIEAPCGKNPLYHTGKIYSVLSEQIANEIYNSLGIENYVNISSETGVELNKPSYISIKVVDKVDIEMKSKINKILEKQINSIDLIRENILQQKEIMF